MNLISSSPEYFLLIIPMIFAVYYTHFWPNRGSRLKLPLSIWGSDRFHPRQGGFSFLIFISTLFFWFAILLIITALSGPERVDKEKIYLNRGSDIMLLLDESPSMFARDLGVSRFEAAKQELLKFISDRENDSIGFISYSTESVLRVPPTQDYEALKSQIKALTVRDDTLGKGTDIGMALAFASYHLASCSGSEQVIILLTDGVNNSGRITPVEAASHAAKMGIRIYPIAIGSRSERSSLLIEDLSGNVTQGEINGGRNDRLLKQLASRTGGRYYNSSTLSVLTEVLKSISIDEPVNAESRIERHRTVLVSPLVLAALVLLVLHFIIRKIVLKEVL